jgi:hypothetical protein
MVKHGTQKKRRRGQKTVAPKKKHIKLRIANKVTNLAIKEVWDKNLSPADNISNFGLNANPNQTLAGAAGGLGRKMKPKPANADSAAFVGLAKVPTDDDLAQNTMSDPNPKRRVMSEMDQEYAVTCIKKHGEDYEAMARDIKKCNVQQFTEHKLKKMCKLYNSLPEKDKLVSL